MVVDSKRWTSLGGFECWAESRMGAVANKAKRSLGEVKRVTSEVERVMPAVALTRRSAWAQSATA